MVDEKISSVMMNELAEKGKLTIMKEPIFKNYKEKQNYYKDKYVNREKTLWVSKRYGRGGKVLQQGRTYEIPKGRVVYKKGEGKV